MANGNYLEWLTDTVAQIFAKAHDGRPAGVVEVYARARIWITQLPCRVGKAFYAHSRSILVGLGLLLLPFILWGIFWKLPQRYAASWDKLDPKEIAMLEGDTRTTMVQAVGGLVLFVGLFFTWKTWRTTQEGQITERFTKAINQLGEAEPAKLAIRLGGIYALERIANDSKRDHWPIMEVLTAYVREHVRWEEEALHSQEERAASEPQPREDTQPRPRLPTDIQAILTVLGRRGIVRKREEQELDLFHTDLSGARLIEARLQGAMLAFTRLQGAYLTGAELQGAHLEYAQLQGANLMGAQLQGVHLEYAQLQGADISLAQLQGAYLTGAQLQGANFALTTLQGADLTGANLESADLRGAWNVTVEQFAAVKTLYCAHINPRLLEHIRKQYPQLLEEPQPPEAPVE